MAKIISEEEITLVSLMCDERTKDCFILTKSEGEKQTPFLTKANFITKKR